MISKKKADVRLAGPTGTWKERLKSLDLTVVSTDKSTCIL